MHAFSSVYIPDGKNTLFEWIEVAFLLLSVAAAVFNDDPGDAKKLGRALEEGLDEAEKRAAAEAAQAGESGARAVGSETEAICGV